MFKPVLAAALFAAVSACSPPGPRLSIDDGWARETGQSETAAAYVRIANKGGADELKSARATIGDAMLHESTMDGGVMRMRPIDPAQGLVVPSNGSLRLAPGGAHVMLSGLKRPLRAGDRFDLTLLFARAGPQKVTITVQPAAGTAAGE